MNLNIREFNYMITIHKEGSITKAAEVLHIAQPSLSLSVKKIEEMMGVQLFMRSKNRMRLTYAGERFVDAGLKIQKICRNLENELKDISLLLSGRIILGIPFYLGSYIFPLINDVLKKELPDVKINLLEGSSTELEAMVGNGTVDLAIMPLTLRPATLCEESLFRAKILLMMPQDHWMNEYI